MNLRRSTSRTWLSSTASTRAISSLDTEAGFELADRRGEHEAAAVDVDLADLRPRGAQLLVVAPHDEGGDRGGLAGKRGEHVEQLAQVGAGGVDDGHGLELGKR